MQEYTKAVYTFEPGRNGMVTEKIPDLLPDEVLCEIKCAGICGTDHGILNGEFSDRVNFPVRPGHEWTGVVAKVGSAVSFLKVGDRVVGETSHSCGVCENCASGDKRHCLNLKSVGTVDAWPGAMAEYAKFAARDLIKLPESISFELGALIEPTANALMAIDDAKITAGDTVVVMGTGPIGCAAVKLARLYGATTVIVVGRSPFKLDICKNLGATHVINTREIESVEDEILKITGGKKVDVTLELSGALDLFKAGINITRPSGIFVLLAFYSKTIEMDINDIIFSGITIRTAGGGWGYFDKVINLMKTGALDDLNCLITSRITLDEAAEEIVNLKKDNATKIKVMICN